MFVGEAEMPLQVALGHAPLPRLVVDDLMAAAVEHDDAIDPTANGHVVERMPRKADLGGHSSRRDLALDLRFVVLLEQALQPVALDAAIQLPIDRSLMFGDGLLTEL